MNPRVSGCLSRRVALVLSFGFFLGLLAGNLAASPKFGLCAERRLENPPRVSGEVPFRLRI
eukprot:461639-Pyramimonas_sp.AAC.1